MFCLEKVNNNSVGMELQPVFQEKMQENDKKPTKKQLVSLVFIRPEIILRSFSEPEACPYRLEAQDTRFSSW